MGPRIYPSQQDTNLTAKGSFILTLSNTYINDIQVTVNGILRDVEYSNLNGFYTTNINTSDIVTILLRSTPTNYYKTINVSRRDYTTDEVAGNAGIVDTLISNNNSFSTTGLTVTFTATTLNYSYNFEYRIGASIMAGTPTPTPTPSPTPTPQPFVLYNGAVGGQVSDLLIDGSDNVHIIGEFAGFDQTVTERSNFITKVGPNGGVLSGYTNIGYLNNPTFGPLANVMTFTADDKIMMGGRFWEWQDPLYAPRDVFYSGAIIKMNKDTRNVYQVYPDSLSTGATQNGFFYSNDGPGYTGIIEDIIQQSDGKFIIGGGYIKYSGVSTQSIIRINDNGTIDNTFSSGTGFLGDGSVIGIVYSLALQSDGKIICGGDFNRYNGFSLIDIVRLTTGGTRDTSFTSYFSAVEDNSVNKVIVQPDGKILVAGFFYTYNSVARRSILRLNTNGTLDTTFGSTSGFTGVYSLDGVSNGKVYDMILQSDGKILCAGDFTGYSGVSSNNIIRLNNDGTIDTTFSAGTGFNGPVYTLARQSTGNIMVGGLFTTYNGGGTYNNIIRLSPDGGNNTLYIPPTPTPTPTSAPPTPTPTATPVPTYTAGYYILVNDSVASYPGTGTTWTSIATGTTYNGALTNGPVWSGGTPGYFTFDGTNDWVDFGAASSGSTSGSFTFGGWVKTTTSATQKVLMMRGNDASGAGWSLFISKESDDKFQASVVTTTPSTTQINAKGTTTMLNDTWYYVIGVWTPGVRIRIYVNGVLETTTATTRTNLRTSGIGWNLMRGNVSDFSNGSLSEFVVYPSVLTGPQIGNNFNANKTKYGY
jgi:uncharacterized delta-60 repeat protein